ncbi:GntR family transcriptional regulator [Saccharopolyspora sp. NPDC050389]|uniref:GntR family transcriptional regulator n=1 Tax=Saccharopolyspora sp. NPDC050389 TaxID=3155516 RepID=UPI003409C99F
MGVDPVTVDTRRASNAQPETTAEQVAEQLRDRIFRGALVPDEPLREVALSAALSVSRRSVREALLILARQGLVNHEHYRGARVRRLVAEDVVDLYRVRRALEVQGVRASPTASTAARARLKSAYDDLCWRAHEGDSYEIIRADLAFHGAVVGLSDSARIDEFFRQISVEMHMAIAMLRADETRSGTADVDVVADHAAIYAHLVGGDVFEAQLAVVSHIDLNERRLLKLVEQTAL